MSYGKTVVTLNALHDVLENGECALILAPKYVSRVTWPDEYLKWEGFEDKFVMVTLSDSKKKREKELRHCMKGHKPRHKPLVVVTNFEKVKSIVDYCWMTNKKWPFKVVVIDEVTAFKNPSSLRFKALKKIIHKCRRVIELTGTPAPNGPLDLWSQLFLLDLGRRLETTYWAYRNKYFTSDYMGYKWTIKKGKEEEIRKKISDICFSLPPDEASKVPDVIYSTHTIPWKNEKSRAIYDEFIKNNIYNPFDEFQVDEETGVERVIIAQQAAILVSKMRQMCNGAVNLGRDGKTEVWQVHNDKLDELEAISESGENLLVAYQYLADYENIKHRFPKAVHVKEENAIERWNKGEITMLIAHPKSIGHGMNLQYGGNVAVWYGQTDSLELYQQFNARLARTGQDKPVRIIELMMEDSVEQDIKKGLEEKNRFGKSLNKYIIQVTEERYEKTTSAD